MKHLLLFSAILIMIALWNSNIVLWAHVEKDGKTVFVEQKCTQCHSVEMANIEPTGKGKITDLSNTGANHTEEFLVKYLQKLETIKQKKHAPTFKGTADDLTILGKWLSTLKVVKNK